MIQFYELEINIYNESNSEKNLKSADFKEKLFPSQKCDKDYFKKNNFNVDEENFVKNFRCPYLNQTMRVRGSATKG